jgi:hypothetical protein
VFILIILGTVTGSIFAAGASFAQIIPAEHLQAGTLTCDISGGIGFFIGSQKALNCSFVATLPGPPEFYPGVINKLRLAALESASASEAIGRTINCP